MSWLSSNTRSGAPRPWTRRRRRSSKGAFEHLKQYTGQLAEEAPQAAAPAPNPQQPPPAPKPEPASREAEPCGTGSRARDKTMPMRLKKKGVKESQPLRSMKYPEGLPALTGRDKINVEKSWRTLNFVRK